MGGWNSLEEEEEKVKEEIEEWNLQELFYPYDPPSYHTSSNPIHLLSLYIPQLKIQPDGEMTVQESAQLSPG